MSLEYDKTRIKEFFERHHGKKIYYSDIHDDLGISLQSIVEACDELEKDGKIKSVSSLHEHSEAS